MSMATVATQNRVASLADVAMRAGVAYSTASSCLNNDHVRYAEATVNKVKQAAAELRYNPVAAKRNRKARKVPANPVFSSRVEETAAMNKLRSSGHSNQEVSQRCGVSISTVNRRIGTQPETITVANLKLAGRVRSAKAKIKKTFAQQQAVAQYNELAAQLNAQLEAAQKMADQLATMQKSAAKASKATGTPLLRLLPPTKVS